MQTIINDRSILISLDLILQMSTSICTNTVYQYEISMSEIGNWGRSSLEAVDTPLFTELLGQYYWWKD